ncbi:hypothetical protein OG427_07335 [Streptomyces sp. NBC_00133]|uniref:hypothetical protein n=1 Tax=Streptomyces sp. NBC_00133 TaxID=2903624 RepID=UPI003255B108
MNPPERTCQQRLEELLSSDSSGLHAAETLWYDRLWLDACAEAARTGSAWLDDETPARETDLPNRVHRLLAEYIPKALPAMQATLHAAAAAQCLAHRGGRQAVRHRVLAALAWAGAGKPQDLVWPKESGGSWSGLPDDAGPAATDLLSGANPHLPWELVDDLIEVLGAGPVSAFRSRTVPVISDAADGHVIRLHLMAVKESGEQALPEAGFATLLPDASRTTAQIAHAFSWARAREGFPRGTGLRWQLLGHGGRLITDCLPVEAGAAAAVGFAWMFLPRARKASRQDPDIVVHATLTPNGLLAPAPPPPGQLDLTGQTVVVAEDLRASSPVDQRVVRPQAGVDGAWRATRRPKGRRAKAVALLVAVGLVAGAAFGMHSLLSSQDNKRRQVADDLAGAALRTGADSPADALRLALAASALDPDNSRVQQALLTAGMGETNLSRVVPTGRRHLRLVTLSADGRYMAVADADQRLRLWDTVRVEEVTLPHPARKVDVLTFAPRGDLLAVSSDAGVQLWDVSAGTPTRTLSGAASAASLAFDDTAQSLAAGTEDGRLLVWRKAARPDEKPLTLGRRALPVRSICFPAAGTLAATGEDETVTLWRTDASGAPTHTQKLVSAGSSVLCVSERRIVVADRSKLYVLSPTLRKLRNPVQLPLDPGAVYRPDTDSVLIALANGVKEIRVDDLEASDATTDGLGSGTFFAPNSHPGNIAAASGDGSTVAVPTSEGDVRIYRSPKPMKEADRRRWAILAAYPLAQEHRLLLVGGGIWGRGQLTLTDSRTGKVVTHLALKDRMRATGGQTTTFSHKHALVATPMETKGLLLTKIRGDRFGKSVALPRPAVPAKASDQTRGQILTPVGAAFDDERDLLFAFWGRSVVTYKISDRADPEEISRTSVDLSLGGMALSADGRLLFADTPNGQKAHTIDATGRVSGSASLVSPRPTGLLAPGPGQSLFTASVTGQVFRYTRHKQTNTWTEYPLPGHKGPPALLRVDGNFLISVGEDSILRLTRADNGRELGQVPMPFFVATVERVSGETLHISSAWDEHFSVPVSVRAQRRHACEILGKAAPDTVAHAWPAAKTDASTTVCRPA